MADINETAKKKAIAAAWNAFGSSAGAYGFLYDAGFADATAEIERLRALVRHMDLPLGE